MAVGNKEVFITFKYIFLIIIFFYCFINDLNFRVEKSNYFRRDGADVHTDASISMSQAMLGGTIRIQGVYEDQTIQVYFERFLMDSSEIIYVLNDFRLCPEHHHIQK